MIDYLFEEANIATTIFMDEGSNTSFITTKSAEALNREGKVKLKSLRIEKAKPTKSSALKYRSLLRFRSDLISRRFDISSRVCLKVPSRD